MNGITWELGFFCPSGLVEGGHPHPALVEKDMSTEDMTCAIKPRCHDRISNLEEKHMCWFEVRNEYTSILHTHCIPSFKTILNCFYLTLPYVYA